MSQKHLSTTATLYVVATPIGNLGDMVPRAIDILQTVDCIAAEDTRHSGKLLSHFNISTPMIAYHDHSDHTLVDALLARLVSGQNVALISDAGTPLISDPGYRLVHAARKQGLNVCPVPGACALIAALSASGLPSNRFSFEGFLPAKTVAKMQCLEALRQDARTLIFYESPHRIADTLEAIQNAMGAERPLVVARELSKAFETFLAGTAAEVLAQVQADHNQRKGEFVVMVQGHLQADTEDKANVEAKRVVNILMADGLSVKQAASLAAKICDVKKNGLYRYALERADA